MSVVSPERVPPVLDPPPVRHLGTATVVGVVTALALMAAAVLVPLLTGWNVHVQGIAPLRAMWDPRVGPGTVPSLVLAVLGVGYAPVAARRWRFGWLAVGVFGLAVAWLVSLATVDGWSGIGRILGARFEYLPTARETTNIPLLLHQFISRIPFGAVDNFHVHVAGHPPGALLFFVLLVRVGLGGDLAAGFVVLLLAATTPVAVLLTLRRLGGEGLARSAAPFLVLGPAAIWMAVSADAMFGAVAAWGLCALGFAVAGRSVPVRAGLGLLAGLLLGACVMLSYGLPLLGVLALTVAWLATRVPTSDAGDQDGPPARGRWPVLVALPAAAAVVGASIVVGGFAVLGFAWWEAFPVLRQRYWDGAASKRPDSYWSWGDLAALCFSAGPLVGGSVAAAVRRGVGRVRADPPARVVVALVLAAGLSVLLADASGMSKSEVERIWLPFVPWLLVGATLLPPRWRRPALGGQVLVALLVQHLLQTGW